MDSVHPRWVSLQQLELLSAFLRETWIAWPMPPSLPSPDAAAAAVLATTLGKSLTWRKPGAGSMVRQVQTAISPRYCYGSVSSFDCEEQQAAYCCGCKAYRTHKRKECPCYLALSPNVCFLFIAPGRENWRGNQLWAFSRHSALWWDAGVLSLEQDRTGKGRWRNSWQGRRLVRLKEGQQFAVPEQ